MSADRLLETLPADPQQADSGLNISHKSRQTLGIPGSPFLTLEEGAAFLRFDVTAANPVVAFRKFLHRHSVPVTKRGRVLLVERRVLEAVIHGE